MTDQLWEQSLTDIACNHLVDRTDDMHYRLRVVDLVDALAKQRSTNPLLILTLLPLFGIARSTALLEEELQTKATKILRHIVGNKKDAVVPASPDSALEALAELHTVALTVEISELGALCSQTAIYLVKAALASPAANAETSQAIADLYGDSFEAYLTTKNSKTKVQPFITADFAKRSPACAWPLFERFVKMASGETASVNAYRRMQAFEVAQALLTSYAALVRLLSQCCLAIAHPEPPSRRPQLRRKLFSPPFPPIGPLSSPLSPPPHRRPPRRAVPSTLVD